MVGLRRGPLVATALVAGFLTVLSLLLPWFDVLGRERSSIDILKSASVLDVIEGPVKALVLGGWLLAPVLVSVAMFAAASGRHRAAVVLLLPVGVATITVVVAGGLVDEVDLVWGAFVGLGLAVVVSLLTVLVLLSRAAPAPPTT